MACNSNSASQAAVHSSNNNSCKRSPYNLDLLNHLTNNIMKKYGSEFELISKLTNLKHRRLRPEPTSRSFSSLPLVKVTAAPDMADDVAYRDEYVPTQTQSNPCSPRVARRAFATCLDGTQYIIGK
ncbi:calcium/calmodulin-dependent 3p 5p-cyclic nucleotide phosphodiesterase 1C [Biomphalaria glabrata]|nr:calcium/calmodulin-dependent 3'; 5'-cyclic nucleotide phosphodiesterase 1C [Biomphalaria glabrata]KAI8761285.1 calcium/calmodulin-dependent 3,5-cyclic nucleotide phosphodiesterase 1C [Biomphalaria glabrata]